MQEKCSMNDSRDVLQYSDWIVTPITGHYAESKGDFQHLSVYMDKCTALIDYSILWQCEV